jgi:hypothetical protein
MKKIIYSALALAMMLGAAVTSSQPAEARRGGGLVAGAIVGGVLAGALIAGSRGAYASGPACYHGPRQCEWQGRHCFYNRYGDYVCRGGDYRCWRPRICD